MIRTAHFKVSPSAYLSVITRAIIYRLWWLAVVPAALIAYGVAADWRWAVVGLATLFIVYPMAMSFTILRYATLPSLAGRASATLADIDECSDIVILYKQSDDDNPPVAVERATIIAATVSNGYLRLHTAPRTEAFIMIPVAAFTHDDFKALMSRLAPSDTYDFTN